MRHFPPSSRRSLVVALILGQFSGILVEGSDVVRIPGDQQLANTDPQANLRHTAMFSTFKVTSVSFLSHSDACLELNLHHIFMIQHVKKHFYILNQWSGL